MVTTGRGQRIIEASNHKPRFPARRSFGDYVVRSSAVLRSKLSEKPHYQTPHAVGSLQPHPTIYLIYSQTPNLPVSHSVCLCVKDSNVMTHPLFRACSRSIPGILKQVIAVYTSVAMPLSFP